MSGLFIGGTHERFSRAPESARNLWQKIKSWLAQHPYINAGLVAVETAAAMTTYNALVTPGAISWTPAGLEHFAVTVLLPGIRQAGRLW